jgi:NADPH-dependent 2,4-dienoyl-CoA reductase/sulfur reductase-like enzyme
MKRSHPDWDVIMFEKGAWTSYAACGFPYVLSGQIESWDKLVARSAEEHRKRGIDVRLRSEVIGIDTEARKVRYRDLETNAEGEESFDLLVYATGAEEFRPPIEGLEHGDFLQSPEQAKALGKKLEGASRVVVVGSGYIGLEMAEALCIRKIETVIIDAAPQVMSTLDPGVAALVQEAMEGIGAEVRLNTPLSRIEKSGDGLLVHTKEGPIEADAVVLALGSRPRSELAKASGIALGKTGAVAVDHRMETNIPGIFAAGDCAEVWHLIQEEWVNIHLGTVANKTGRIAGINAAGGSASFPGALGTAVSKICRYEVARTGLTEREASKLGLETRSATIKSKTRAHYYPGAGPIHVKLVIDAKSQVIIGGQIVGTEGAAKRIDVLAAALASKMTALQLVDLDLSYAPPYSPVWDPVQMAARQLLK